MSDNEPVIRQVIGLEDLLHDLDHPEWLRTPTEKFLNRWGLSVQAETVANFQRGPGGWIDTAETRKSVATELDTEGEFFPEWARVGSNRWQFRWGEYGTGLLSEDPESAKQRHWPPADALEEWAAKHGMTGGQVAAIIGIRGGLEPRRYLREAVATIEPKLDAFRAQWVKDVEAEAEKARNDH
jgi:hypothetical protein